MRRRMRAIGVVAALVFGMTDPSSWAPASAHGDPVRRPRDVYDSRLADWRNHQIVYQVFVDRFNPGSDPETRRANYGPPRRLRPWRSEPTKGTFIANEKVWSHEVDFWGGDLPGLTARLDYIKGLGANVVYLNPIFLALTNHKYDTTDYFTIDPQYGTKEDFARLCDEAHKRGMRVVLDGGFNHTGRRATWFQAALEDPSSEYRGFYTFGADIKNGYLGWLDLENLPELDYTNPAVRDRVYRAPDSVVRSWLAHADGWLQDVTPLRDLLTGQAVEVSSGLLTVTVPPKTVQILAPVMTPGPNYDRYKRIP